MALKSELKVRYQLRRQLTGLRLSENQLLMISHIMRNSLVSSLWLSEAEIACIILNYRYALGYKGKDREFHAHIC